MYVFRLLQLYSAYAQVSCGGWFIWGILLICFFALKRHMWIVAGGLYPTDRLDCATLKGPNPEFTGGNCQQLSFEKVVGIVLGFVTLSKA